jgi:uncharacterized protein
MVRRSNTNDERQAWTLRIALTTIIACLVIVSLTFNALQRSSQAATTQSSTTSTTIAHHSGGSPGYPPTGPTSPVTGVDTDIGPSRGCNLEVDNVAVKVPGSKRKVVPTLASKPLGHCRIMVIGDSLGEDIGWGIQAEIQGPRSIAFWNLATPITGLSNPWYYNWPVHLETFLKQDRPNLLIVALGGNDEQNIDANGQYAAFGSSLWKKIYRERIAVIADEARAHGAIVLWVGMPIMQPYGYRLGMLTVNKQFYTQLASVSGATYLPTWSVLASSTGQYLTAATVNHQWQALRSQDGVHFAEAGELVIGTDVVEQMEAIYHVHVHLDEPEKID